MQTIPTRRRALTALTVSISAALATAASFGCSSNGSSFDSAGGTGSGTPTAGNGSSNPTAGTGQTRGGSGSNETQVMGGSSNPGGGIGTAGSSTTGGNPPQGGNNTGGGTAAGGTDGGPACPKPAGQICHEFFANDNSRHQINYVNEFTSKNPGGVEWSTVVSGTDANAPRTMEIVDNPKASKGKAILVSISKGYAEVDMVTGTKLVEVSTQLTGVTGACRMDDGTTALGIDSNPAKIVIVNANGVQSRAFNLPNGANLRAINYNRATKHFWFSLTQLLYEVSDTGQLLWQANMGAGSKGYAVWWRDGGGAYATSGELHTVLEIDGPGNILTRIGDDKSFAPLQLDFFSGFVRRPNGNYIVANWLGHNMNPPTDFKDVPQVIEFQPDGGAGKAVWQWGNQTLARQITNVFVVR